jgi:cation:H+ antiporter
LPASIGLVALGLVLLILASDRLVVSAVRVSRALGLSAVLIGAVVVGLGTSIPELLVSALASGDGELDVAMSNVVGSNVANVTLVLGVAALLSPVVAHWRILRREGMLMLIAVAVLATVLFDEQVGRTEGLGLLLGLFVALTLLAVWSRGGNAALAGEETEAAGGSVFREFVVGIGALAVTVFGANLLLDGALDIGERMGLSDTFLGLLLGVGTSLPELATAAAAARRRESDLIVGNVLGSNIFNSLAVAGTAGIVGPGMLADLGRAPLVVMVATALVAGVFSRTGSRITRPEGVVLVAVFLVFGSIAM